MAGKTVTTSSERQTICSSEGDCNIDAVFVRLVIAKYYWVQVFSCLVGFVRRAQTFPTPLEKWEKQQ